MLRVHVHVYTSLHTHFISLLFPVLIHLHVSTCVLAELMKESASMFQTSATRLKRKLWWQNVKLWIILIIIFLVIVAVIVG